MAYESPGSVQKWQGKDEARVSEGDFGGEYGDGERGGGGIQLNLIGWQYEVVICVIFPPGTDVENFGFVSLRSGSNLRFIFCDRDFSCCFFRFVGPLPCLSEETFPLLLG